MKLKKFLLKYYVYTFLCFLCDGFLLVLISYLFAKQPVSSTTLFDIIVPKYYSLFIGLFWIKTFVVYFLFVFKEKNAKLWIKIFLLLIYMFLLFCIMIGCILFVSSIRLGLEFTNVVPDFLEMLTFSIYDAIGIFAILSNIGAIVYTVLTIKDIIKDKLQQRTLLYTILASIFSIIIMIVIQNIGFSFLRMMNYPYARNTYESVYAVLWILGCWKLKRKLITKKKEEINVEETNVIE